jgi:peptide-methionine (R)-S-oxide reductase
MSPLARNSISSPTLSAAGHDVSPLREEEVTDLARALSAKERRVLLHHGTEPAFSGTLLGNTRAGTYACRMCGLPLFASNAKFDAGTGWPSFHEPVDRSHVACLEDRSHGRIRTEVRCARCGGHLGHVFSDGPSPTRERYCIDSVALEFVDAGQPLPRKTRRDRVQGLAHQLWQERGSPLGSPDLDWFQAEELLGVRPSVSALPLFALGIERRTS